MAKINNYILVCGGTGCRASRSEEIIAALRRALDRTGESERTRVIRTGCFGFCEQGPIVKMIPDNTFYVSVKPEDAEEIVREHVVKGRKVERLLYTAPDTGQHVPDSKHMKFYKPQLRIALRNCGFIDPENIGEYIARDGYAALAKVLGMQPDHVLQEIIDSGLRPGSVISTVGSSLQCPAQPVWVTMPRMRRAASSSTNVARTALAPAAMPHSSIETRIWGSSSGVLLFSRISRSARSFSRMRRNSSGVFIFAMFSGRLEFDFSGLFAPACRKISRKRSFFRDRVVKYNHLLSK